MERLVDTYFDPRQPGSFGSPAMLSKYSGQSLKSARQYLSGYPAYTLHRPVRHRFARRRIYSKGPYDLIQIDLCDLSNLTNANSGIRYLLVCICVFTKQAWVTPLRTKTSKEVADAFDRIISMNPTFVQSDKGTEFLGEPFQSMLRRRRIKFYTTQNETKCAVAERFIRTLKSKIHKYLTHRGTQRYLDVLQDIVHSYNHTYHRSIGMAPNDVTEVNSVEVAKRLYPPKPQKIKFTFKVGDRVRVSYSRDIFRKGYVNLWSDEIFTVTQLFPTTPPTYGLTDANGTVLKGRFYAFEIQTISDSQGVDNSFYTVDKIIRTRKRNGHTEYLVRWKGYDKSHDSWTRDVISVQQR